MAEIQAEDQFRNICGDLNKFILHVSLDMDTVDDNAIFKKCSKCNRPTIDHENPVHKNCTQKVIKDPDDIYDIEKMLNEREEFKEAFEKLIEKVINDEESQEELFCDICEEFCETENGLNVHKESVHEGKINSSNVENLDDETLACEGKHSN